MKKWCIALVLSLSIFSCEDHSVAPDNPPNLRELSSSEIAVSSSLNDFGFNLFRKINQDQNTFISPLSVSIALGMVLNGASDETAESILQTIDFGDLTPEQVNQAYKDLTGLLLSMDRTTDVRIANSVWYHNEYNVKNAFEEIIENYYDGVVQSLDFKSSTAKNTINSWVADKTNDRIQNLIDQISGDEIMFLINAIYFKGEWQYQFDASKTHDADFTREDGSVTTVSMMQSKGSMIQYGVNENVQLIDIPYGNGQFRMTVLVPEPGGINGLAAELTSSQLNNWLSASDSLSVELEMPKFKMTWKKDLKDILADMGMKTAGFPKLFEENLPLAISRIIHQSFLEVNEKGSEAAAATAIGIGYTSLPPKPLRITIDRPFIFFIREKHSGVILFSGQLKDPTGLE